MQKVEGSNPFSRFRMTMRLSLVRGTAVQAVIALSGVHPGYIPGLTSDRRAARLGIEDLRSGPADQGLRVGPIIRGVVSEDVGVGAQALLWGVSGELGNLCD